MPWSTTQCGSTDPGPGNILDLKYNFNAGAGDNGNVVGITNDRDGTRSQSFSYDTLNRLTGGWTTSTYATSPSHCWGESYQFDNQTTGGAWGNLTSIGVESSAYNGCVQENLNVAATTSNRISGYCYDAAGNLLQQGTCPAGPPYTYTYNAVNQITLTAGVTYSYDGDGRRVEKSIGPVYWYGIGGDALEETSLTGAVQNDYVFFGGQRIARLDSHGDVFAYFTDHLGSSRKMEEIASGASTASLNYDADFYPFGREHAFSQNNTPIYKFTGKQRDDESGLDNFGARYNSSNLGRFISPDPIFMELHRLADPQQLNLYSYVRNNPLSLTDPSGMLVDIDCSHVNSDQCKQTVTDLNGRKDAQFQVTRDGDTGQLNVVGSVDASKLSGSEAELYKAITDPKNTATLDVRSSSDSIMFDQYAGKGLNILDRADLNQLGKANSVLPGEAIAHAAVEAYAGVGEGMNTYDAAHGFANKFFGDVRVSGLNTLPPGAATATSAQATYNFQRVGVSVNVQKIFIVPQPAASVNANWERIRGNLVVSISDQKKP